MSKALVTNISIEACTKNCLISFIVALVFYSEDKVIYLHSILGQEYSCSWSVDVHLCGMHIICMCEKIFVLSYYFALF